LFSRTQEQIKEEEALLVEMRRIQMQQRRLQRDYEHVMRLLNIREVPSLPSPTTTGRAHTTGATSRVQHQTGVGRGGSGVDIPETPKPSVKRRKSRKDSTVMGADRLDSKYPVHTRL
jgi:hypothetical protein